MSAPTPLSPTASPPRSEAEDEALRRARRLLDISVALNTLRDPGQLLLFIIETATEVFDCGAASVLLYNEDEDRLRFVAATGQKGAALAHIPVPLHGSIAGTIFRENRPVLVADTEADERHFGDAAEATDFHANALLGVPMRIGERPIGVFEVLNPASGSFSEDDIETLLVLSAQAAVAIDNARRQRALTQAHERLAELDQVKSDFMALASHELRTPLSIILSAGGLLRLETDAELTPFVDNIIDAGDRMHRTIEMLEEMSVLQDGDAQVSLAPTILQEVLRAAWDEVAVEEAHLEARLDVPEAPMRVEADGRRLRLAFQNLLANAVTFTPEGGALTVTLAEEDGAAHVCVEDSGPGLSEADCARVFEAFYQVEDHLTREHEGMGMGLTVAAGIVRLHSGRLWATSDGLGHGCTFQVRLPLA